MPRLYKQNCKQCGEYYEGLGAKYFCSLHCANINPERITKISKSNTGKVRSEEFKLRVGEFHKGNKWSLGRKLSDEHKKKIGDAHRGMLRSEETKKKFSEIRKRLFKEGKLNFTNPFRKGSKHSRETIVKMLETRAINYIKENHYNWQGGLTENPYPLEFNKELKIKIRERDNFTCQLCSKTEEEELREIGRVLSVNHIDFDKTNCSSNNLNTLCVSCNIKINYDRDKWTNYFKGGQIHV